MALSGLEGATALVTGGGSGIGAASAHALAAAGATVAVTDLDAATAEQVAAEIVEAGGKAVAHALDVVDEDQWAAVMAQVGPLDVLHSNAGPTGHEFMSRDLDVLTADLDIWRRVIDVALTGSMLACRSALPGMIERGGGSIICTSSVKGLTGSSMRAAYNSAKGGLHALVRTIATGYGHAGVRANAVAPGIIDTPGLRQTVPAARLASLEAAHLLPRLGTARDVADAVVYLASPASSFVTGQVLVVDGGMTSHTPALSPDR
jgi:NAD(P)-dependent dehydrogenase (short-subunit alcohol dehydrogenase family)